MHRCMQSRYTRAFVVLGTRFFPDYDATATRVLDNNPAQTRLCRKMVEHEVDHNSRHGNVHPDWERELSHGEVPCVVAAEGAGLASP